MKKKVVKAHKGMAHVPLKSKSTSTKRRVIGLPQPFIGGRNRRRVPSMAEEQIRDMFNTSNKNSTKAINPEQLKTLRELKSGYLKDIKSQPKRVVRPPKQTGPNSDILAAIAARNTFVRELPNKGRIPTAPRTPLQPRLQAKQELDFKNKDYNKHNYAKVQPRILNQGGYMSRANYGQVDNLKKGK